MSEQRKLFFTPPGSDEELTLDVIFESGSHPTFWDPGEDDRLHAISGVGEGDRLLEVNEIEDLNDEWEEDMLEAFYSQYRDRYDDYI